MNSNIVIQRIPRMKASIMLLGTFYEVFNNAGLTFLWSVT
jgi:hypothetical protein